MEDKQQKTDSSEMTLRKWQYYGLIIAMASAVLLFGVPGAIRVMQTGIMGVSPDAAIEQANKDIKELSIIVGQLTSETGKIVDKVSEHESQITEHESRIGRNEDDLSEIRERLRHVEKEAARLGVK